jgi:hypothetical protein
MKAWHLADPRLTVGIVCICTVTIAGAETLFDDHFEGASGGVPAGWIGFGTGTAIEVGTTVTLLDEYAMYSETDLDPDQAGLATVLNFWIAETDNHASGGLLDFAEWDNHFWVKLFETDGRIEVKASNAAGGEEEYVVGFVPGYAGQAIQLTLILDADSFAVATDSPSFLSGVVPYGAVFTTFTRSDLGHGTRLVLENECSPGVPPCVSVFDRLTVEVGATTPVDPEEWGSIKAAYR